MKLRITYLVLAAVVSFIAGVLSRAEERFDYKVRNDFFAGFSGDREALERGMKATETILAANPKHAEALVWHGAGLCFLAGFAFQEGDRQKGHELGQRGMAEVDQAVALEPNNIGVRIPRGAMLLKATRYQQGAQVPELLERAVSDYQKAYDLQQAHLDKLGTHPKGELLLGLADGYNRLGDKEKAKMFYERAAKELPGTVYERSAKEWLETGQLDAKKAGCLGCHATR